MTSRAVEKSGRVCVETGTELEKGEQGGGEGKL